ncbi:uncharacterized protein LOC111129754 [Crassostrea virginica]
MAESADQVDVEYKKFSSRCIKHDSDLLPVFCRDCNRLMCSDCLTTDHVGHNLCKVSDVAEFHQSKLEEILKNSDSMSMLEKMLLQLQEKQINLVKDSESLICRISEREEEIIQIVKHWSQKLIGNVNSSRERRRLSIKHDEKIINALLHFEELSTEMDTINIIATYLNCEMERLLPSKFESTEEEIGSCEYKFEVGSSGKDLNESFGRLELHQQQESSSDVVIEDNENVDVSDLEDESNFYECHENKVSCVYQTCAKDCIDDIVVFDERRIFILSRGTLFLCETKLNDHEITQRIIKQGVYQIAHIRPTRDLLLLLENKKEIHRLSYRNIITKFTFMKTSEETFCALNSGGHNTYACLLLRCKKYSHTYKLFLYDHHICLLDEYGVTLKKYSSLLNGGSLLENANWKLLPAQDRNNYILLRVLESLDKIDTESNKKVSTYSGAIGICPKSQFSPSDMTIDDKDNVLLVVRDDNAIHLLDKSLKFQRLILTEEDGLHSPWSVTLDSSGYLWVGCQDGKIHVFNYQYLLETERSARYH